MDDQTAICREKLQKKVSAFSQQVRTLAGRSAQGANGRDSHEQETQEKSPLSLELLPHQEAKSSLGREECSSQLRSDVQTVDRCSTDQRNRYESTSQKQGRASAIWDRSRRTQLTNNYRYIGSKPDTRSVKSLKAERFVS